MPLAACFLFKYPALRLIAGSFFVAEILGLKYVMSMDLSFWLPLSVVFVDWDWVIRMIPRLNWPHPLPISSHRMSFRMIAISIWCIAFAGYHAYVGVAHPNLDNKTYPFTSFPIYSSILAKKPYNAHQSYEITSSVYDLFGPKLPDGQALFQMYANFYTIWHVTALDDLESQMKALNQWHQAMGFAVEKTVLYKAIYQVQAYPAPSSPKIILKGRRAERTAEGHFRGISTIHGRTDEGQSYFDLHHTGFKNPSFRFAYIQNRNLYFNPTISRIEGQRYFYETPKEQGHHQAVVYVTDTADDLLDIEFWGGEFYQ